MEWMLESLREGVAQMTWTEGIAVLFGFLSVWYAKQKNILVFPTGMISVLIYVYICYQVKLYADMGIQIYYFLFSIYGWINWSRKDAEKHELPITRTTTTEKWQTTILGAGSFFAIRYVLIHYTDSDVPTIDAFTTALFIVGMWLMAKKKIENWTMWIIADAISIPLYLYKGLVLTSFQYLLFLILAIMAYFSWRKSVVSYQIA